MKKVLVILAIGLSCATCTSEGVNVEPITLGSLEQKSDDLEVRIQCLEERLVEKERVLERYTLAFEDFKNELEFFESEYASMNINTSEESKHFLEVKQTELFASILYLQIKRNDIVKHINHNLRAQINFAEEQSLYLNGIIYIKEEQVRVLEG